MAYDDGAILGSDWNRSRPPSPFRITTSRRQKHRFDALPSHARAPRKPNGQTLLSQQFQVPGSLPEWTNPDPCHLAPSVRFLKNSLLPPTSNLETTCPPTYSNGNIMRTPSPTHRLAPGNDLAENSSDKLDAYTLAHRLSLPLPFGLDRQRGRTIMGRRRIYKSLCLSNLPYPRDPTSQPLCVFR